MSIRHSLSGKLSFSILAIAAVLFALMVGAAAWSSNTLMGEEAVNSADNLLEATIGDIENTLQQIETTVKASAWLVEERKDDEQVLSHITERIVSGNGWIVGSAIAFRPGWHQDEEYFAPYSWLDENGTLQSKRLGDAGYDYYSMEWYAVPAADGVPHWSKPYRDTGGGGYLMSTYSYPLKDAEGEVYAVITADITIDWLQSIVDSIKPYPNSIVTMVSSDGSYIKTGMDSGKVGDDLRSTLDSMKGHERNMAGLVDGIMSGKKGHAQYYVGNEKAFAVFGPVSNGWTVVINCAYRDVLKRTKELSGWIILIGILGLAALFALSWLIIHKLTKPLSEFSEAVLRIGQGDINTSLPAIRSEDEIHTLYDSFKSMQRSLTNYISDLKSTTAAKERYEGELSIASKIQQAMVPTDFISNDNLDIYAVLKPAKEVGGDLYDFYFKDGDTLWLAVGDVSGKGIPAALIMAITRASFRFISGLGLEVDEIMSKMNNALCNGNSTGMFVTLFAARIDLRDGRMDYCNAGHNAPVIIAPDGTSDFLEMKPNIALGVFEDFPFEKQSVKLEKGSRLLIYTDGVNEAESREGGQYGNPRLLDWAAASGRYFDGKETCNCLLDDIRAFTGDNPQNDDITILTIKI